MPRTRVKICGLTRPEDVSVALDAGADALGFVFYAKSPRHLDIDVAVGLLAMVPPFVSRVALFMNPDEDYVRAVIRRTSPDLLQFHGAEQAEFCESFERPYIKAVPMGGAGEGDVRGFAHGYRHARGFLLDSNAFGEAGGSGKRFDWRRYPGDIGRPIILAGGLDPDNVAAAVSELRPYAVDVSSGVESAPGVKDAEKVRTFVEQATGNRY